LLLSLVIAYIYISQGRVEMRLPCSGIYNNHIANCLQSISERMFENRSIIAKIWTKVKWHVFYGPQCTFGC